eukprot:scaffold253913_cov30-Tisochrysis_lutea.AAC.2
MHDCLGSPRGLRWRQPRLPRLDLTPLLGFRWGAISTTLFPPTPTRYASIIRSPTCSYAPCAKGAICGASWRHIGPRVAMRRDKVLGKGAERGVEA